MPLGDAILQHRAPLCSLPLYAREDRDELILLTTETLSI